jgi:hypothetical protein
MPQEWHAPHARESERWRVLCERYLPLAPAGSIWRFSRPAAPSEPEQGWKLHISATVINACSMLETVAPLLHARDVQFKAPASMHEISRVNSGLYYG